MTPLKCLHLNSVTRLFILITILVSMFSQSFDCKPTTSLVINTLEKGNISHTIDNDNETTESNSIDSPDCDAIMCFDIAPRKNLDEPPIDTDTRFRGRRRLGPATDDALGDNENDGKSNEKDRPILPEYLLYTLQDYKIMMDPSVEKVNNHDYRVTLHVNVIRKQDNRKEMELPSIALPLSVLKDANSPDLNSSIIPITERVKEDLKNSLSTINDALKNNNQDRSANPASNFETVVTTPTIIGVKTDEDPTSPSNIDPFNIQPDQNNQTSNVVSASSLRTTGNFESRDSQGNSFAAANPTTSTTMDPLLFTKINPSLTPLPRNEVEKREEEPSTMLPEITTTSKIRIATPNPVDLISASTLANVVRPSEKSHASSNVITSSTEVSKAVESRIVSSTEVTPFESHSSSTSSSLQTSSSSSMQPKMSEIELNHSKSLYDKIIHRPVKPIPETPWIPAYEVKPIGFNKQDSDNHIEYRFAQHDNEFNVRRNIPSNKPQPQPQPHLQPQPRLNSQPRYEPSTEMRMNNDRRQKVIKADHQNPYLPRFPSVPLKGRQANVPKNRNEPYAVEEIVHFEGPSQRLNTRQYKPTPELFVRIIRHYFDNALSPDETVYTAKHKSPIIAPGQPLYQRSPSSLSYQNSKP